VPRLALGGIGPEQQKQPVPADAVITGGDDGREQPEAARTGTADSLAVSLQPEPAKRTKSEHQGSALIRA
jgi:hypothetical protein